MNHHKFLLSAPYDDVDVETEGVNGGVKTGHGAEQKSATLAPA